MERGPGMAPGSTGPPAMLKQVPKTAQLRVAGDPVMIREPLAGLVLALGAGWVSISFFGTIGERRAH